jgi:molybdopterin/thiamine biosynthesis adenylyltransferase
MSDYFLRQIALWGEETQESLQNKRIAIIGCGGLGSTLALTLGSSGIGYIELVDFDTLSTHNLHRQIAYKIIDIGGIKCEILASLVRRRCTSVEVVPRNESFDEFCKRDGYFDLIVDATDNLPARAKIDEWAKKRDIPWIYASVEGFNGQVCFMEKASFDAFTVNDRKPGGIAPPIVAFIAAFEANLVLRYLAGLSVEKDVLNYLYFDENGALVHKKFGMPT